MNQIFLYVTDVFRSQNVHHHWDSLGKTTGAQNNFRGDGRKVKYYKSFLFLPYPCFISLTLFSWLLCWFTINRLFTHFPIFWRVKMLIPPRPPLPLPPSQAERVKYISSLCINEPATREDANPESSSSACASTGSAWLPPAGGQRGGPYLRAVQGAIEGRRQSF